MKREDWIDALKGFGIFCVTIGHLRCQQLIETHIYSFHMFLFFFLSGFLHKNSQESFKTYAVKKTKTLLLPFLVWDAMATGVYLLASCDLESGLRKFFVLDGEVCWNAPIWFLLQLYMVELLYFLLERYIPYGQYISIPALAALWVWAAEENVFLKLNILPICLLFYILGNIFRQIYRRNGENCCRKRSVLLPAILALLLCLNLLFGVFLNERISFTGANFGNVGYCAIAAVTGTLFYVLLFENISVLGKSKVLAYLGKNSLIIMASQYWLFYIYDAIYAHFGEGSLWYYRSTGKALALTVVTLTLICGMVRRLQLANKRWPCMGWILLGLGIRKI